MFRKYSNEKAIKYWSTAASEIRQQSYEQIAEVSDKARSLLPHLNDISHHADHVLRLPRIGTNHYQPPKDADFSWRPQAWRAEIAQKGYASVASSAPMGRGLKLFHDCPHGEIALRQVRNSSSTDLAPFGVSVEVFDFAGTFLSFALELPDEALTDLSARKILQVDGVFSVERPLGLFVRLNIQHGPNVEQVLNTVPLDQGEVSLEFDLGYLKLNEKRMQRAWLDIIFENPKMNAVTLRDFLVHRRPRAQY